jgi:uncharacterized coiled-coil DUF342 family protein
MCVKVKRSHQEIVEQLEAEMSKIQQVHGEQMMQVHEELDRALKELDIVKQRLGDSRARTCELSDEVARVRVNSWLLNYWLANSCNDR